MIQRFLLMSFSNSLGICLQKNNLNIISELKEFEKTDLITYINRLAERDIESPETANLIVESINRVYELFFMHCRIQNRLLPYKKDYFS